MIRRATPDDVSIVLRLVRELAVYEKLEHEVDLDPGRLREALFGPSPLAFAWIAEDQGAPVGFALAFLTFSTFRMRACLHLEDLFVLAEHRGRGHGLALLREVAAETVRRGGARLQWNVLDWNVSAIGFYEKQGARLLHDWRICRVDGEALLAMAAKAGA